MKRLTSIFLSALLLVTMAGCAASPLEDTPSTSPSTTTTTAQEDNGAVKIGTIQGPTGIGMVHLMEADKAGTTTNKYAFSVATSPEEISTQLANPNGGLDIAAVPTNMAAALYQKTQGKVKLLAINTLGVLYMLENGNAVQSVADLRGKTIYSTGEGANPEYILRYVLSENGIDPDNDVNIEFLSENTELVAKLSKGKAALAMVPEPMVSTAITQNPALRIAFGMNDAWNTVAGENNKLMMGCVAVRSEFLENNKTAVDNFLKEYKASIENCSDVDATASLCEKYGIIPKAAIAKKAIPNCGLVFVSGADMKTQIAGYYDVLFQANPKSLGGKLPDDAFYYAG